MFLSLELNVFSQKLFCSVPVVLSLGHIIASRDVTVLRVTCCTMIMEQIRASKNLIVPASTMDKLTRLIFGHTSSQANNSNPNNIINAYKI